MTLTAVAACFIFFFGRADALVNDPPDESFLRVISADSSGADASSADVSSADASGADDLGAGSSNAYENIIAEPNNLGSFRGHFTDLKNRDMYPWPKQAVLSKRGKFKVALGVFTSIGGPRYRELRKVHRQTWMRHPQVCSHDFDTDKCMLVTMFVAGIKDMQWAIPFSTQLPLQQHGLRILTSEPDVILLDDLNESKNTGRSFYWLQYAAARFPWADYVAKAEDDVFIHASTVINSLPIPLYIGADPMSGLPQPDCEGFYGKPWACFDEGCPPVECGPPVDGNFTTFKASASSSSQPCWALLHGGFYVLTRSLAARITVPFTYFYYHKSGPENMMTSRGVDQWAHQPSIIPNGRRIQCVRTWKGSDVAFNRMFLQYTNSSQNERPAGVSADWDAFYQY